MATQQITGRAIVSDAPGDTSGYAPSWIDQVLEWVTRLPIPVWSFYLGSWMLLAGLVSAVKWLDGTYPAGTFFLFHVVLAGLPVYVLALAHYMQDSAAATLRDFRSVLDVDDQHFHRLNYELTTNPARPSLAIAILGVSYALSGPLWIQPASFWQQRLLFTSPLAAAADSLVYMTLWALIGGGLYQMLRQLRLIGRIYTRLTRINLLTPGPLYAFSGLSARAAIGMLLGVYAWYAADPVLIEVNGHFTGQVILFSLLAAGAIVQPLLALHSMLTREKRLLLDENGRQLELAIKELHRRNAGADPAQAAGLEGTISSLVAERAVLQKLRTWPWEQETANLLATAALLPIVLWIVQRLLERAGF